ncbi:hypothetical protein Nepgr_021666 [Nepenthes gracilis]|uniref:Uncharacterized protein n=1 Tax=Nepenthes gracilis TaxID=150966 RepID=A0AAD3SZ65_NEPGR|nr:hypothetical protein Nepgr_021666 [Nepenthes gracilis]
MMRTDCSVEGHILTVPKECDVDLDVQIASDSLQQPAVPMPVAGVADESGGVVSITNLSVCIAADAVMTYSWANALLCGSSDARMVSAVWHPFDAMLGMGLAEGAAGCVAEAIRLLIFSPLEKAVAILQQQHTGRVHQTIISNLLRVEEPTGHQHQAHTSSMRQVRQEQTGQSMTMDREGSRPASEGMTPKEPRPKSAQTPDQAETTVTHPTNAEAKDGIRNRAWQINPKQS